MTAPGAVLPRRWKESFVKPIECGSPEQEARAKNWRDLPAHFRALKLTLIAVMLTWHFYASTVQLIWMIEPGIPFPTTPIAALEPFEIAESLRSFRCDDPPAATNRVSRLADGQLADLSFRFKPQDPSKAPGILRLISPLRLELMVCPRWVPGALILSSCVPKNISSQATGCPLLFRRLTLSPSAPPHQVRAVLWQYCHHNARKHSQGLWWRRQPLGLYAPALEREPDGRIAVLQWPTHVRSPQ